MTHNEHGLPAVTLGDTTFEILPDECPENPRDWDCNLGTMTCWHRRYALGDPHHCPDPQTFARFTNEGNAVILPLFLFDHSGLTISTDPARFRACDPAGWDWGQVGFVYCTFATIRHEFGARRVTHRLRGRVEEALRGEVATYDQYLRGEVFGFALKNRATGEVIDSCWGFFGGNPWKNGMTDYLPPDIRDHVLSQFQQTAA